MINLALAGEPQRVWIGDEIVVVVSEKTYELRSKRKPTRKELLLNGPDLSDLDLTRNQSPSREFEW